MTEAEKLVAKFNAETERVIYTTQEAWDEWRIEMDCVELYQLCELTHLCTCVSSCINATPIAFS